MFMYQASVPVCIHALKNLAAILKKGEEHAAEKKIDEAVLTSARLFPDMLPLAKQVLIATDIAKGCGARLAGVESPVYKDTESTFAELQQRIARTIAYLETLSAEQINGSEEREINMKAGPYELKFTGENYLNKFALPNIYFHVTTSYSILRHNGVPLGKMDFLGEIQ